MGDFAIRSVPSQAVGLPSTYMTLIYPVKTRSTVRTLHSLRVHWRSRERSTFSTFRQIPLPDAVPRVLAASRPDERDLLIHSLGGLMQLSYSQKPRST